MDIRENFSEEWGDPSEVRRHVEKFGSDPTNLSDVKAFILYLFASRVRHHDFSLGCGYGGPGNRTSGGGGGQRTSFSNVKRQLYHHFTTAVDTRYELTCFPFPNANCSDTGLAYLNFVSFSNIRFVFSSVKEMILRKNLDALMLQ